MDRLYKDVIIEEIEGGILASKRTLLKRSESNWTGDPAHDPLVSNYLNSRRKKAPSFLTRLLKVVGEEGFEPPTLWSQTRCATKLRYSPRHFV